MSITNPTQTRLGAWSYLFSVESTLPTPTFYWYVNGELVEVTDRNTRQVDVQDGGPYVVEVFDDINDQPAPYFPARATFQWAPSADGNAAKYLVEEYEDPDWITRGTILDATSAVLLRHITGVLDDDTDHIFGITPVSQFDANPGARRSISFHMRRNPDAPVATFSYDDGTGIDTATVTA